MRFDAACYGWVFENVAFPTWERVRGRPTNDYLTRLEQSQWMTEGELEARQVADLRALLRYAASHVPYYRALFRRIGFHPDDVTRREHLAELPLLTRDIIRDRYAELVDPVHQGRNLMKGTSGSTGMPLKFEYSRESHAWREATKIRGYRWGGYRIGVPSFHYWAQVHEAPRGLRGTKLFLDRALKREVFIDSMRQREEGEMRRAVERLRRARPHVLICYTQAGAQWARFILDHGLRDWPDTAVLCGAEAVLPADRDVLRRAFGPDVFETYGSRETMLIAAECSAHDGLHLSEENLLVEVARGGALVPDGRPGDVVVTDLHNYGMPFIRYVNGDVAAMSTAGPCPCGRGLRKLDRVVGRRAEMIRDREGRSIPGIVFHVLLSDARREVLKQFQVVQREEGELLFRAVRGQDWDEAAFARLVHRIESYLQGIPLRVEFCDAILPASNGKYRTIVVERAPAQAAEGA